MFLFLFGFVWFVWFAGCLVGWLLNVALFVVEQQIVHSVATSAAGPFEPADIAVGPRGDKLDTYWDSLTQHNPQIAKHNETYLLFYMVLWLFFLSL